MTTLTKETLVEMVLLVAGAHKVAPKSRVVADACIAEYEATRRAVSLEGLDEKDAAVMRALDFLAQEVKEQ